jgi:hypothetical protein
MIGQTPAVELDLLTWARWFEEGDRRVRHTRVMDSVDVSTVFLGLNHNYWGGPPLLFETMLFWPGGDGYEQRRCSTWEQAEKMHREGIAEAASAGAWMRYLTRTASHAWERAKSDWEQKWKELRGMGPAR